MDIRLLHLGLGDKFGASYIVELILASGISDSGIIKPKFVECSSWLCVHAHFPLLFVRRCYCNFLRSHNSLKFGKETRTPAIQAGLANRRLSFRKIFTIRCILIILDRIRRRIGSIMVYEARAA